MTIRYHIPRNATGPWTFAWAPLWAVAANAGTGLGLMLGLTLLEQTEVLILPVSPALPLFVAGGIHLVLIAAGLREPHMVRIALSGLRLPVLHRIGTGDGRRVEA